MKNEEIINNPLLLIEIMKNISQGVYLVRTDNFTIVYTNRKFEEMFGYGAGEMIGKNIEIINAPTDKTPEETRKAIVDILTKNKEWHGEVENIKKDGTRFWCYANASLFEYPEFGQVILAVHTDITEQKLNAQKQDENEEVLKDIFDNSLLGMALVSPTGKWLKVNKAVCEILGYSEQELLTMDFKDVTYPEERARDMEMLKKMLAGEINEYRTDKRYITKDGRTIWARMQASLVRDKENKPLYSVTAIEDINEHRKAEEELKEAEQRFKTIFDYAPSCITLNRLSDGKFVDVNGAFLRMTGYEREEVMGKTALDLNLWAVKEERDEALKQMREKGNFNGVKTQWRKKSGETVYVTVDTSVIDIGGEKHYLGLIVDTTEIKNFETRQQEKIAEMEKMNKFMMGREIKMIELKKEIDELKGNVRSTDTKS